MDDHDSAMARFRVRTQALQAPRKSWIGRFFFGLLGWALTAGTGYVTYLIYTHQPAITIDERDNSVHLEWGWDKPIPEGVEVRTIGGIETPRTKRAGVKPKPILRD